MTEGPPRKIQCEELVGELIDVCGWLADGHSTPDEFRRTIVAYEARKLSRLGYTLSSSLTADNTVHFSLRTAAVGDLCASVDVVPATGQIIMQQAWV